MKTKIKSIKPILIITTIMLFMTTAQALIPSLNKTNKVGSLVQADDTLKIKASKLDIKAVQDTAFRQTKSTEKDMLSTSTSATTSSSSISKGSNVLANSIVFETTNDDIVIQGSDIKTNNNFLVSSAKDVLLYASYNHNFNETIKTKSGFGVGGNLYGASKDTVGQSHNLVNLLKLDIGTLGITSYGDTTFVGVEANIKDDATITATNGDVSIANAYDTHESWESHETISANLDIKKLAETKLEFKASYEKEKEATTATNVKQSDINAGGKLTIKAKQDIAVVGSLLKADDIELEGENVVIKEAKEETKTTKESIKVEGRVKVKVENYYVQAAKIAVTLKTQTKQLEQAKKAKKEYEKRYNQAKENYKNNVISKEQLDDIKDEKKWYKLNITMIQANIAKTTIALAKATAVATSSSGVGGHNIAYELEGSMRQANSNSSFTTSVGSNIRANNLTIKARDKATISGSKVVANTGDVRADTLEIKASEDTSTSSSSTKEAKVNMDMTTGYIDGQASISQANSKATTYNNSTLNFGTLTTTTTGDTTLSGANIDANKLDMNIGGDLTIRSLQDSKKHDSGTLTVGTTKSNLNIEKERYKSVGTQTSINTKQLNIKTQGNTDLIGAKIVSTSPSTLSTGTLTYSDLENQTEYSNIGFGSDGLDSPMAQDKDTQTNTAISNTITVDIKDKTKQTQDISKISNDTQHAHYRVQEVNKEVLNIRKDVAGQIGKEAFKAIGDIYDSPKNSKIKELIPKELFQALAGATMATISGNGNAVSGATASIVAEKASDAILKIAEDGSINKHQMKAVATIASMTVGGLIGGDTTSALGGANIGKSNIDNNMLPHMILAVVWVVDKGATAYEAYNDYKRIENGEITKEQLIKEKGAEYVAGAVFGTVAKYGTKYLGKILNASAKYKSMVASANKKVETKKPLEDLSLLDKKGKVHILDGDGVKKGGGHRYGTGKPGKTEFPKNWSDTKIKNTVSDIATDPKVKWITERNGYKTTTKTIDGIKIKVVYDPKRSRIVSSYPTNTLRNPK